MMERLYSRQAVRECLRARRRKIHKLVIAESAHDAPILREIQALAQALRVPIANARRDFLDTVSPHHQGIALEVGDYPYVDLDDLFSSPLPPTPFDALRVRAGSILKGEGREAPLILILDALQDPQNFGNLIRTAEAVGVNGIVIGERRSVSVTPAVVNASSGAVEHMRVARVVNLARAVDELKERDVWVAALHSDSATPSIYDTDLRGALALIVGGEGEGVSRLLRDKADFLLRLPMRGLVESLNAAVAGSVALYEVLRQRLAGAAQ